MAMLNNQMVYFFLLGYNMLQPLFTVVPLPIGSMYAMYGNIYHQYTPNVSIYTIHGSYGLCPRRCKLLSDNASKVEGVRSLAA